MKKYKNLLLALFVALASGCSDMLDIKPTSFISDEAIWEDKVLIDKFVANTYGSMLCGFNRCTAGIRTKLVHGMGREYGSATDDFASVSVHLFIYS